MQNEETIRNAAAHGGPPPSAWAATQIKPVKLSTKFEEMIAEVKPLFTGWLNADITFEKNTKALAGMVQKAWHAYQKQEGHGGRIGFARLFDPSVPEGKTARELWANPTFNRINYLIDKVNRVAAEGSERIPVRIKREKMQKLVAKFHREFARKEITVDDVDRLVVKLLAQIWPEDGVHEVISAAA